MKFLIAGIVGFLPLLGVEVKVTDIVPKPEAPFVIASKKEIPALKAMIEAYMSKPPREVKVHPAAKYFPGAVTSSERVTREVSYSLNLVHRWNLKAPNAPDFATEPDVWQETGLYAAPGELVTVTLGDIPPSRKVSVVIGCHADALFDAVAEENDLKWHRFPLISRSFKLSSGTNHVANAFGGQIFIHVEPADADKPLVNLKPSVAKASMTFSNAVTMPTFHETKDNLATWKKSLAESAAPWGTLVSHHIILHLPRVELEKINDPKALLVWWDKVIEMEDDLVDFHRHAPERMVPDKQINGGYMHSGYPFMCHLDPSGHEIADLEKLQKSGNWGIFHELGHNHQNTKWTFSEGADQGEVTCNFFSLYCMDKVVGVARDKQHPALENLDKLLAKRLENPPNLEPFEQLSAFAVLIRAQGWGPLRETLRSYAEPLEDGLKGESALKNLFVQRYGMAAKSNIAPFFAKLGYPITKETRNKLHEFPVFDPSSPIKNK
jgi:hypothetical protein